MNGSTLRFTLVTEPSGGLNPTVSVSIEWPDKSRRLDVLLSVGGHEQNWRPRLSQAGVPGDVITAIGRDFQKLTRAEKA